MTEINVNCSIRTFSVAMSVYGKDNPIWFERALESLKKQTIKPNEIVLVVDGTVPAEIQKVIDKYTFAFKQEGIFLNVVKLVRNQGLGNALKIAVDTCENEWVARMDSDDISFPKRFEQQLSYITAHPEVDIIGGDITEFIGEEKNIVGRRKVPKSDIEIKKYMKTRCAMNHVSVMYKKSSVIKSGGYLDWFWNEDYYLWIRMVEQGCVFANTGTVLVNVRTGADMYSRRGGLNYFKSELGLQNYMLKKKMIGVPTYLLNIIKRLMVQVLMPNKIRGWVFRTFAREKGR